MSGIDTYKQNTVMTQSPGDLIVMLYDGAVRFLKMAAKALEDKDFEAFGNNVIRALEIVDELDVSLDMDAGGEIAENLRSLYCFMRRHLHHAHVKKDPQMIQEVISILDDLNEGWKTIAG